MILKTCICSLNSDYLFLIYCLLIDALIIFFSNRRIWSQHSTKRNILNVWFWFFSCHVVERWKKWQTKSNFTDRFCQTALKYSIFGGEKHAKKFDICSLNSFLKNHFNWKIILSKKRSRTFWLISISSILGIRWYPYGYLNNFKTGSIHIFLPV